MLIGELAKSSGVSIHTVRYYERFGLFAANKRRDNNYKEYPAEAVHVITFVKRSKELGFTLHEVKAIVEMAYKKNANCNSLAGLVTKRLEAIDSKIAELKQMKTRMRTIAKKCANDPKGSACALVEDLLEVHSQ